MPDEPTWLSTAAAAKRLGLRQATVYRLINDGSLPAYRFGRVIRIKQSDLDAFVAASQVEPGTSENLHTKATHPHNGQ